MPDSFESFWLFIHPCLSAGLVLTILLSACKPGLKTHIDSSASGSTISSREFLMASLYNLKFASVAHNIQSDVEI